MNKTINISDLIFEKIKHRYHFQTENKMHQRNARNKVLVDSFYPAWIAISIAEPTPNAMHITTGQGYAISERVATDLNSRKLHISELTTMLGYTKTDIGKLLQATKNKEYDLVLVGLGGTGSNVIHWLYEMMQWTGKEQIFRRVRMFDDDEFDIPNMLRIPFIPEFTNTVFDAKKVNTIPKKFNNIGINTYRYTERLTEELLIAKDRNFLGPKKKTVIYGAPDILTREFLTNLDYSFLAATHRDNEYSIVENPAVDNDLMMETYGKINLSMFFLNHLAMTIEFLKHLGQRTENFGKAEDGTQIENETIVRHNFGDKFQSEILGGFKAGSKKIYVATEDRTTVPINLPTEGE